MAAKVLLALTLFVAAIATIVDATPTGRIVGGYDAELGQFPHQISLRIDHRHTCGGSVIDNNWILTAAHCVVEDGLIPYEASRFSIRAGTHNRLAGGVIIQVKRIIVHQGFAIINDLALLELEEPLEYSELIQPIELMEEEVPNGEEVIISGWGLLVHNGDSLPIMCQWNTVKALSTRACTLQAAITWPSILCLEHPKGAGACNGDSGGPATYNGKLVGVAGFVRGSCGSSLPDGYAKVASNLDWIHENMKSE